MAKEHQTVFIRAETVVFLSVQVSGLHFASLKALQICSTDPSIRPLRSVLTVLEMASHKKTVVHTGAYKRLRFIFITTIFKTGRDLEFTM